MEIVSERDVVSLANQFESATPQEILAKAVEKVSNLTLACSFGAEDVVLLDMIMKISPTTKVFYLDTDLLFPETYDLINSHNERGRPLKS